MIPKKNTILLKVFQKLRRSQQILYCDKIAYVRAQNFPPSPTFRWRPFEPSHNFCHPGWYWGLCTPGAKTVVLLRSWVLLVPLCKSVGTGCQQVGVVTPWERQTRICRRHQSNIHAVLLTTTISVTIHMQGRIRPLCLFSTYITVKLARVGKDTTGAEVD